MTRTSQHPGAPGPVQSLPVVPTYSRDLRSLVKWDFNTRPIPNFLPAGGSLRQRLASASLAASAESVNCHPNGRLATEHVHGGRRARHVSYARHSVLRLGYSTHLLGILLDLGQRKDLPQDHRRKAEEAVWRVYTRRYGTMPLPPALLALLRAVDSTEQEHVLLQEIGRAQQAILQPGLPSSEAYSAWLSARARLLVPGGPKLTDRQTAVAELYADLALLQAAALADAMEADRRRGSGLRADTLMRMDAQEALSYEQALRRVLRSDKILEAVAGSQRGAVIERLERRPKHHLRGLLDAPAETSAKPQGGDAADLQIAEKQRVISLPPAPRTPRPRRLPPEIQPPRPWGDDALTLHVPEWSPLGCAQVTAAEVGRHIFIVGETGSGKTESAIRPLLRAVAHCAPDSSTLSPSLLLIDPKAELASTLLEHATAAGEPGRVIRFGDGGPRLHFFALSDPLRLEPRDAVRRILEISTSYLAERYRTRSAFFVQAAERFLTATVALDFALYRAGGVSRQHAFWRELGQKLESAGMGADLLYDPAIYLRHHEKLHQMIALSSGSVINSIHEICKRFEVPTAVTRAIRGIDELPDETRVCVIETLANILSDAASPAVARHVWLSPFQAPPAELCLEAQDAMDTGAWVVYTPTENSDAAVYVGRALKSAFFQATFRRIRIERPFFYFCDEFQRFITGDPISGEQSFLDRCRAYRAICVLATQTVASLQYALAREEAPGGTGPALDTLLANTATKLTFRTTDPETRRWLEQVIPEPPIDGRRHVVRVRPPATLSTGECYIVRSNGSWGRGQVKLKAPGNSRAPDRM